LTGVISCRDGAAVVLTAMRGEGKPPFDAADSSVIRQLLAHLGRAYRLHERLHVLESGETVLNGLNLGIILLSGGRSLRIAPPTMVRANDGPLLRRGQCGVEPRTRRRTAGLCGATALSTWATLVGRS
jgi:hypothetical protein